MFMLSRGANRDLGVRFTNRKKFIKEVVKQIDELETAGCYTVVSITTEPEGSYEQEYKKIYRRKSIMDRGNEIKRDIQMLKNIFGWG